MIYDIPLIEVKSSVLLAVGYEQISETLRVVFNSGSEYRYPKQIRLYGSTSVKSKKKSVNVNR